MEYKLIVNIAPIQQIIPSIPAMVASIGLMIEANPSIIVIGYRIMVNRNKSNPIVAPAAIAPPQGAIYIDETN
jgi:hypothetical protein